MKPFIVFSREFSCSAAKALASGELYQELNEAIFDNDCYNETIAHEMLFDSLVHTSPLDGYSWKVFPFSVPQSECNWNRHFVFHVRHNRFQVKWSKRVAILRNKNTEDGAEWRRNNVRENLIHCRNKMRLRFKISMCGLFFSYISRLQNSIRISIWQSICVSFVVFSRHNVRAIRFRMESNRSNFRSFSFFILSFRSVAIEFTVIQSHIEHVNDEQLASHWMRSRKIFDNRN